MEIQILILIVYAIYLAIISIFTFVCYGVDKFKAKRGGTRISEKALITLSIIGGAFGGLFAMNKFRHKTKGNHWYFTAVNVFSVALHTVIIVYLAMF